MSSERGRFWQGAQPLYDLENRLESRAISFENLTGDKGASAMAASPLGVGRKGSPARFIAPGETVTLADIEGPGTIRHIWMTTLTSPTVVRGMVIRIYWEGQEHPSVEAPLADFFGFAHGATPAFESEVHSVSERYGMNIWAPMPFTSRARVTLTNDLNFQAPLFYQIDYTVGDRHPEGVGRLHVLFARSNPTQLGEDFELLPKRKGQGRFLGAVIGVRPLDSAWWGEGEAKFYIDGDDAFPTIASTGAEDYAAISFCIQPGAFRFHGANYREKADRIDTGAVSMYRWHVADPIFWSDDIRVTIQQIGLRPDRQIATLEDYTACFYERQDDWSTATFWYEATPSAPLPAFPDVAARIADLPEWKVDG